ncbi:mitochondrial assembly of ribosomal large subunit protein 1 [Dendropsophus ebraccatus]|uniref:mitochondrial assembly of ribosomal large subunit protein 1 n=1 Tax=Dendropsophus ebraccatus TaxID=150705 RepID=UPI0038323106
MWAPRLSRLCARWSARSVRSWRHHAEWGPCPGAPQLPAMRTCLLQSCRPYSAHIPDTESTYSTGPGGGGTEDAPERRGAGEALPDFNINVLVNLLRQENGKDLCVIRVPPEMKYVEYFVIVGGTSTRHIQAMAQYTLKVYKFLKGKSDPHVCLEGKDTDDWMCIDFGNIVVHFMLPETRETYELEKLWTLRSYDDQLSEVAEEVLPLDFTFGLQQHKE